MQRYGHIYFSHETRVLLEHLKYIYDNSKQKFDLVCRLTNEN